MLLPLSRGFVAVIDDEDASLATQYRWHPHPASRPKGLVYVAAHPKRGVTIYLHRLIMGAQKGQQVDHINRDGLDNRRVNLRLCDQSLNNAHASYRPNKNGFRGVTADENRKRWRAIVWINGKRSRSRWTKDIAEAARMYDEMAIETYGDFAVLNFPEEGIGS